MMEYIPLARICKIYNIYNFYLIKVITNITLCAVVSRGGGVLPYMGYIGMCRREGYDFQAVYSRIGYVNQSVWV